MYVSDSAAIGEAFGKTFGFNPLQEHLIYNVRSDMSRSRGSAGIGGIVEIRT